MMVFLVLIIPLSMLCDTDLLLNLSAELSQLLHRICLSWGEPNGDWTPSYQALVCGAKLQDQSFLELLRQSGLYHLVVVSGLHLQFLQRGLSHTTRRFGPKRFALVVILLAGYCLMCRMQPPVVRALIQLTLLTLNHHFKWRWPPHQTCLISGFACLLVAPSWWDSLSLQISWLASLTLSCCPWSSMKRHVFMYFMLFPVIATLAPMHPLTIIANWLLAPIIALVLFPASLVAWLVPPLTSVGDFLWQALHFCLTAMSDVLKTPQDNINIPQASIWLYLFAFQIVVHAMFQHQKRIKCDKSFC